MFQGYLKIALMVFQLISISISSIFYGCFMLHTCFICVGRGFNLRVFKGHQKGVPREYNDSF